MYLPLEPSVKEWAILIALAEGLDNMIAQIDPLIKAGSSGALNPFFWKAHNAAIREGVLRADSAGLRRKEPEAERAFINIMLYNVLEPGDQCAKGNMAFCVQTNTLFLNIGSRKIYPNEYPATWEDVYKAIGLFSPIWGIWGSLGARFPSDVHMYEKVGGE